MCSHKQNWGIVGATIGRPLCAAKTQQTGEHCSPLQVCAMPFRICKPTDKSKFELLILSGIGEKTACFEDGELTLGEGAGEGDLNALRLIHEGDFALLHTLKHVH